MAKKKYEVRVREKIGPNRWMKKSKFYEASSPAEARACYTGSGHIMWVSKVSREKLFGIGEFFTLGDRLLKEMRQERDTSLAPEETEKDRRIADYERKKGHKKFNEGVI